MTRITTAHKKVSIVGFSNDISLQILAKINLDSPTVENYDYKDGEWHYHVRKHHVGGYDERADVNVIEIFVRRQNYLYNERNKVPKGQRINEAAIVYKEEQIKEPVGYCEFEHSANKLRIRNYSKTAF
jgi:hypothetical protein